MCESTKKMLCSGKNAIDEPPDLLYNDIKKFFGLGKNGTTFCIHTKKSDVRREERYTT